MNDVSVDAMIDWLMFSSTSFRSSCSRPPEKKMVTVTLHMEDTATFTQEVKGTCIICGSEAINGIFIHNHY